MVGEWPGSEARGRANLGRVASATREFFDIGRAEARSKGVETLEG
jgi:hypothetical protein